MDFPRRLLVTILIGNNIINVASSIIAVIIVLDIAESFNISPDIALSVQIIVLTALILLFGEITPKVFAAKNPILFTKIIIIPFYWISAILFPISETISEIIATLFSKIKFDKSKTAILEEEIEHLAELGHEQGTLHKNEQNLIRSIISYKTVTVKEIMRPRVDITAISVDTTIDEVMNLIKNAGHSRIPLYEDSLDEVIGIIYAKDILPALKKNTEHRAQFLLTKNARKPMFVPETKLISTLMREFQEKKTHIAIVVDEYGGTAGLVTLEDILEEIIGDIRDEFDKEEKEIIKISENSYIVRGSVSVDEINDLLGTDIHSEEGEFDTIGGFILDHAAAIPEIGYKVTVDHYKLTVKHVDNNRITKIMIEKKK